MAEGMPARREPSAVSSGDELETQQMRRELAALEAQLAQRELELMTLRTDLKRFEIRYHAALGDLEVELAEVEGQIAEALAERNPEDQELRREAEEARERATENTKQGAERHAVEAAEVRPLPNDELKNLYREVARTVHPDLAQDESEVELRQNLMAEANAAYARGDAEALRSILEQWRQGTHGAGEQHIDALRRTVDRVRVRLAEIEDEILKLTSSALHQLKTSVERGEGQGRDLLAEMRDSLTQRINDARVRLSDLRSERVS
jgi:hypothetical protein